MSLRSSLLLVAATALLAASPATASVETGIVQPNQHLSFLMFPTSAGPFYSGSGLAETLTIWAERPFSSGAVDQVFLGRSSVESFDGAIEAQNTYAWDQIASFANGDETAARYTVPLFVPLSEQGTSLVCCADTPPFERPGVYRNVVTELYFWLELDIPADSPPTRFWVRATVPEPSTWALLVGGFGLLGAGLRRARAGATLLAAPRHGAAPN